VTWEPNYRAGLNKRASKRPRKSKVVDKTEVSGDEQEVPTSKRQKVSKDNAEVQFLPLFHLIPNIGLF
jgi:hypothetical protein